VRVSGCAGQELEFVMAGLTFGDGGATASIESGSSLRPPLRARLAGNDSRPLSRDPYPETLTLPITAPTVTLMRTLFEALALAAGSLTAFLWLVS
jgi:hypothetical protein